MTLDSQAALAYDRVHDRYLKVFFELKERRRNCNGVYGIYSLYGVLVDRGGTPVGPTCLIAQEASYFFNYLYCPYLRCSAAFDYVNRRFLVVWPDYRDGIGAVFGQFVDPDGSLIGSEGNFRISRDGGNVMQTDLAFDAQAQRFLVVWDIDSYPFYQMKGAIRAQCVDSLQLESPLCGLMEFECAPSGNCQMKPVVDFDQYNGKFCVVWREWCVSQSKSGLGNSDYIKGVLLDRFGEKANSSCFVICGPVFNCFIDSPTIDWEISLQKFIVTWEKYVYPLGEELPVPSTCTRLIDFNGDLNEAPRC